MPIDTVKNSTGPKISNRLGDKRDALTPEEQKALNALISGLESNRDPRVFLDPRNQRSEASVYEGTLEPHDARFTTQAEVEREPDRYSVENWTGSNIRGERLKKFLRDNPSLVPDDPIDNKEYEDLVKLLARTGRQI